MNLQASIERGLAAMGIDMPAGGGERLAAHLRLVEKWNRVHNLTAVRETDEMVVLHVLDSLTLIPYLRGSRSLLDVGSGAGFPGIPLALARPDLEVTLLDSSRKKCVFLEQAKAELALGNVNVVCERVELWHPERRFEVVVSRAFAELADFVVQARHLVAPGGRLLAMKGVYPFEEIARVPETHRVCEVVELSVPSLDAKRHLVLLEAA